MVQLVPLVKIDTQTIVVYILDNTVTKQRKLVYQNG